MFGESIHELRRKKKILQDDIAEKLGVSKSLVSAWECDTRTPSLEQIALLEEMLGGKLTASDEPRKVVRNDREVSRHTNRMIPILGKVWATPFKMSSMSNALKSIRVNPGETDCFALEVEGDSMTPVYNHGDTIICRPKQLILSPFVGDEEGAYVPRENYQFLHNRDCVVTLNGETFLKRIEIRPKRGLEWELRLNSLNAAYAPVVMRYGDEFRCEAVVVRNVLPEIE